jgi:hypothetical protein
VAEIDPSRRVMYVTLGTSLFSSATWEPTPELLGRVPRYREWIDSDLKPDARLMSPFSRDVRDGMRTHLRGNNAETWGAWLPEDLRDGKPLPATLLRYSAELTTILRLAETRPAGTSLADFLNGYAEIRFVHDDRSSAEGTNYPYIAAVHLAHYLNVIAGSRRAMPVPISGLSSTDPDEVLAGMERFGNEIKQAMERFRWFDFIASGGYKLYGTFLADLRYQSNISARLVYLHEESQSVFVSPAEHRDPRPRQESGLPDWDWGNWARH